MKSWAAGFIPIPAIVLLGAIFTPTGGTGPTGATGATGAAGPAGPSVTAQLDAGTINVNTLNVGNTIPTYDGLTTAGLGVSPIMAYGQILAMTHAADGTNILAFTPGADGLYEIGGYIDVTTFVAGTVSMQLVYQDMHGGSHGSIGSLQGTLGGTGVIGTTVATTESFLTIPVTVQAKSGTAFQLLARISNSATADFYGWVRRIN